MSVPSLESLATRVDFLHDREESTRSKFEAHEAQQREDERAMLDVLKSLEKSVDRIVTQKDTAVSVATRAAALVGFVVSLAAGICAYAVNAYVRQAVETVTAERDRMVDEALLRIELKQKVSP